MSEEVISNVAFHFDSEAYELLEKIGQGGFGQVYKAEQKNTGQLVAIKFLTLNTDFDVDKKRRYIARFERETLLCSRLQHPNIVRLLDKGRYQDNLLYAVFEYVDGLTLKDLLLESGALSALESAEIMQQLLDGLAHAHDQGVIHRDIKPANIMLTRVGAKIHAKILDFGIASLALDARQAGYKTLTLTRETLGTPSYSAPEQLRGEPVSPKTDLYVWGLVFIECLTGQPAVSGSSLASVFHKQLSQSNVPLPAAIVGHPLAALLRRALQKKVHERSVTAAELYKDMAGINFSNLVGDMVSLERSEFPVVSMIGNDETLLSDGPQLYTGLTERKQITVLSICLNVRSVTEDVVDYELVDALHRDQKSQCLDTAIRYGGFHVGSLGDTLLFYFGYPVASDNDIRLCARTALEFVSSLNKRNALLKISQGVALDMRIGMHTGLVTCYADTSPEGDTPNIAMQLARMATVDQVLCSDSSRKMLESYIEFEPAELSVLGVDGVQTPIFSLVAERQVEAFGFLRGMRKNYAFIGREQELKQLIELSALARGRDSKTRLAHVYGEAGIGKSRLVFELRNKLRAMRHYIAQCLPEHQNNALYPILSVLKFQYSLDGLEPSDAFRRLGKAIKHLDFSGSDESVCALVKDQGLVILSTWLGLPLDENFELSQLQPEIQKKVLFATLGALLTNKTKSVWDANASEQQKGCLFIFEDMHWADPTSLEFIVQFIKVKTLIDGDDVFISTSRQTSPKILYDQGFELIEVNKLTAGATADFIVSLFDGAEVPKKMLDLLVTRTDGIPLFIEELVNMLQQKGLVHKLNGIIEFTDPNKMDQIPSSLRDSLQQKLDSLICAKETAQLAATIGREFDYNLLVSASDHIEGQIQSDLNELIEYEILYRQRKVDGDSYIFKHALVRDAAYESAPKITRSKHHERIALALENNFPEVSAAKPWDVARHNAYAKRYPSAIHWGIQYIADLSKRSLDKSVIDISKIMSAWLSDDDASVVENGELQVQLNHSVFPAYSKQMGWSHESLKKMADFNLSFLSEHAGESMHFSANLDLDDIKNKSEWIVFSFNHYQGHRDLARQQGEKIYRLALDRNDRINSMVIGATLGQAYLFDGDLSRAKKILEDVVGQFDFEKDLDLHIEFGLDPYHMAAGNLMSIAVMSGRFKEAKKYRDLGLLHALKTKNKATIVTAYTWGACFYVLSHDREGMRDWCDSAKQKSPDVFTHEWIQRYFDMTENWSRYEYEYGLTVVEDEIKSGQTGFLHWYESPLADSLIFHAKYDAAFQLMLASYERTRDRGDTCVIAVTLRELARAKYYCDAELSSQSKEYFDLSISYAKKSGSHFLEIISHCYYLNCINESKVVDNALPRSLASRLIDLTKMVEVDKNNKWITLAVKLSETCYE